MPEKKTTTAKRTPQKKTTTSRRRTTAPREARPPRFAIIGTGRSGTGYAAAIMQANGINCGHEGWFRPADDRTDGLDGDASWLAVPTIEAGTWTGPVAHIVRHPIHVVRSLVGIRFFHHEMADAPYPQFAREHCHQVADPHLDPVAAAVEWWVTWNERCARLAHVKLRVEDLTKPWAQKELGDALGVQLDPAKTATVPTDTNSRQRADTPAARIWQLLGGRARRFGYHRG